MLNVYITGPSCAGKTSCIEYLKDKNEGIFNFPLRVITRPGRNYDESNENTFLDKEVFKRKRKNNEDFFLNWVRPMEENRKEYYGFYEDDAAEDKINIFSCNNALILNNDSVQPDNIFNIYQSLFVAVWVPADIRMKRMKERTPEYSEKVINYRIYRESLDGHFGKIDLKLDNYSRKLEESGEELYNFIKTNYDQNS